MKQQPLILLTNDDGIQAEGLKFLCRALVEVGDLAIVAPVSDKSGVGVGITLKKPLHIEATPWDNQTPAWKLSGTPADCVRFALSTLLQRKPDLIVSGINCGSNAGRNILYSGTVGGVIEGVMRGIQGVAFSCEEVRAPQYAEAQRYVTAIARYLLSNPLPPGCLFNVTIPGGGTQIRGVKLARQGRGFWVEDPVARLHPEGHTYYWMGGRWEEHEEREGSEVPLLKEGFVTAVPIRIDEFTHEEVLQSHKKKFEEALQLPELQDCSSISSKGISSTG